MNCKHYTVSKTQMQNMYDTVRQCGIRRFLPTSKPLYREIQGDVKWSRCGKYLKNQFVIICAEKRSQFLFYGQL